jgi:F-type H+-transporting ATPase subunit epsilon
VKTFSLDIRTPEKKIFSGRVINLTVKAVDGEVGILPEHAPLAAVLSPGAIRYRLKTGEDVKIDGQGGFLIVAEDQATILVH